jgi:HK97 family phage prohead protease
MTGELEFRSAQPVSVDFPNRTITLICMPYEERSTVEYHGRIIHEICSRGAFDGIERRANRVRVNRDHDVTRTVGRAVGFWPSRQEGLVSDIKIAKTTLGDETLTLADEGILDASSAFAVMPGGDKWETRSSRRLNKLFLGHIGLTPDPAYEGAKVLAVRMGPTIPANVVEPVKTPNLDVIRGWALKERYDSI